MLDEGNLTGSWPCPVLDILEKFKSQYIHCSYVNLDYRKTLRRERLLKTRIDRELQLRKSTNSIHIPFWIYCSW